MYAVLIILMLFVAVTYLDSDPGRPGDGGN